MSDAPPPPSSSKRRRVQPRSDVSTPRYSSPDELGAPYPTSLPRSAAARSTTDASSTPRNPARRISIRRGRPSRTPSRSPSPDELVLGSPSYQRYRHPSGSMSTPRPSVPNGNGPRDGSPVPSRSPGQGSRSQSQPASSESPIPNRPSPTCSGSRSAGESRSRPPSRGSRSPDSIARSITRSRSQSSGHGSGSGSDSPRSRRSTSGSPSRYETCSQGSRRSRSPSKPAPYEPVRPDFRARLALRGHTHAVSQVRISPDGRWIASASADASIRLWDAATGAHMDTLVGHLAGVSCVAWSPDGDTLASGSDDKSIRLWDRVTGRPKKSAKSKNNNPAGAGAGMSAALASMKPLLGHQNHVHCLAFSPKGNMLASGSYDEAVFLWDVRAGRLMRSLPAHSDPVTGIDFSRDGTLVVSCSTDGLIRVWDTSTGQCLRTLVHEDNPGVSNVCFSPNGRFVLAFSLDNCVRLWDYVAGSVKKTYQGHRNERFAVGGCFGTRARESSPSSSSSSAGQPPARREDAFIASASEDGSVVLWDVKSKEVVQVVRGHAGVCFWVDVAGGVMVSCGEDRIVKVYRDEVDALTPPAIEETLGGNGKEGDGGDGVVMEGGAEAADGDGMEGGDGVVEEGDRMEGVEVKGVRIKQEDTPIEGA